MIAIAPTASREFVRGYETRRTLRRRAEEARTAHKDTARRIDRVLARLAACQPESDNED